MTIVLAKRARSNISLLAFGAGTLAAFAGCSSDKVASDKTPVSVDGGASQGADSGRPHDDASAKRSVDQYTGDCTTARWGDVSDECWSCLCTTCKDSVNGCGGDCSKGVECATKEHVLVGVAADLNCELRAFTAKCLDTPAAQAAAPALLAFDTCLISSHKPTDHLRACETECGTTYTGDVCQRFPAIDGG